MFMTEPSTPHYWIINHVNVVWCNTPTPDFRTSSWRCIWACIWHTDSHTSSKMRITYIGSSWSRSFTMRHCWKGKLVWTHTSWIRRTRLLLSVFEIKGINTYPQTNTTWTNSLALGFDIQYILLKQIMIKHFPTCQWKVMTLHKYSTHVCLRNTYPNIQGTSLSGCWDEHMVKKNRNETHQQRLAKVVFHIHNNVSLFSDLCFVV